MISIGWWFLLLKIAEFSDTVSFDLIVFLFYFMQLKMFSSKNVITVLKVLYS